MKGRPTASVQHQLDVRLLVPGNASVALAVTLTYDSADPYAVHALFRTGHRDGVAWVFARDTLAAGVVQPSGEGDVRVWPAAAADGGDDVVHIALSSPDGQALLEAPASTLTDFLLRTYAVVPRGGETSHLDIDTALATLLSE